MDPVIFLEKVRKPALRGLVRERLERRTASLAGVGAEPVSLALVMGPPGSGKTTLLSHIAEGARGAAAWYRVGTEDDDEIALTRHLGHTLGAALSQPDVIAAAAAGRIADLVGALEAPTVGPVQLIVDDLHEITGTPAERALESFLQLRPRKIRITLGSRRPPLMNTSRMLVSGELTELDGEDLRFRSWEVEELFRAVYAAPLAPESAAALTRRTGGWAAGLQLFHLATAHLGRTERERAVEQLSGRTRLIRSYLARNVLDGLDPDRRRFLLLTSTLGVLTGDLCDDLLDTSGSAGELAELEREQFFTTSTDGGLTYHYHQVLQTHLEVLLVDELGGIRARELYSRSGGLLEAAGRTAAAIRAHARAEDWGSVARLLKPDATPVTGDEALWGVLSLPGAPTDDPGLVLAGARRLVRHGQIPESVAAFRQAEALLDDPEFRRRCTIERTAAAIWLPGGTLPPVPTDHDDAVSSAALRLSLELRALTRQVADPGPDARPWIRGVAALAAGDVPAATRMLLVVDPEPAASCGWEPLAVRLALGVLDLLCGHEGTAAGHIEEVMLSADVGGWAWLSRIAHGLQAAIMLVGAPEPWRIAATTELLADLEQRGDPWTQCLTSLAIGAVYARIGEAGRATATLRRTAEVASDLAAPVLWTWAEVLRTALSVREGGSGADNDLSVALRGAAGLGLTGAVRLAAVVSAPTRLAVRSTGLVTDRRPAPVLMVAPVSLRCLGGFSLAVDGHELGWQSLRPRVRSLLMLLAMNHGRRLHREELVDTLWPDALLPAGIRSLQVAVSSIRQCLTAGGLTEDALCRHGDAYALHVPAAQDQRADFERLAQAARREAGTTALQLRLSALEQYAGDLLPEVGPVEWVVDERNRLRLLAAAVAFEAAREAAAMGQLRIALDSARRSVGLDAYHDSAWQLLVEINEQLGDLSAAAVARREQTHIWADLGLIAPGVPGSRSPA